MTHDLLDELHILDTSTLMLVTDLGISGLIKALQLPEGMQELPVIATTVQKLDAMLRAAVPHFTLVMTQPEAHQQEDRHTPQCLTVGFENNELRAQCGLVENQWAPGEKPSDEEVSAALGLA